jgi:hypothetical protein
MPQLFLQSLCEELHQKMLRFSFRDSEDVLRTGHALGYISFGQHDTQDAASLLAMSMFIQGSPEQATRVLLVSHHSVAANVSSYGIVAFLCEVSLFRDFLEQTAHISVAYKTNYLGAQGYMMRAAGNIVCMHIRHKVNYHRDLASITLQNLLLQSARGSPKRRGAVIGILLSGFIKYTECLDAQSRKRLRGYNVGFRVVTAALGELPGGKLVGELIQIGLDFLFDELSEAASQEEVRRAARTFIANSISIPMAHSSSRLHDPTLPTDQQKLEQDVNAFFRWFQLTMQSNGFAG